MDAFERFLDRVARRLARPDSPVAAADGVRQAAVVLLLRRHGAGGHRGAEGPDAEILFIKRSAREGDPWSGHLALPGGRAEDDEASLLAVALRETGEEVGVDLRSGGRIIGQLQTLHPQSARLPAIAVTPFVAVAPNGAEIRPQPGEVDEAFWMPLAALMDGGRSDVVRKVVPGQTWEWKAYPSPYGPIWGMTERILTGFIELIR